MRGKKPGTGIIFYLGIIIFFYFGFDLMVNDYPWQSKLLRIMLALAGILVPLLLKIVFKDKDEIQ